MLDIFYFSTKNIIKFLAVEMIQELEIIEKLSKIYLKIIIRKKEMAWK